MKKYLKRLIVAFSLSMIVATCVHFRTAAIERMSPIELTEAQKARGLPSDSSVSELMRMQSRMYAPLRPVTKKETLMLKLEKLAYASPVILYSSLLSPSFLPAFAYPQQFRNAHEKRLPLAFSVPASISAAARAEGFGWGVAQGMAFYLPFFVRRRSDSPSRIKTSEESVPDQPATSVNSPSRERSILDSAISKCDK